MVTRSDVQLCLMIFNYDARSVCLLSRNSLIILSVPGHQRGQSSFDTVQTSQQIL